MDNQQQNEKKLIEESTFQFRERALQEKADKLKQKELAIEQRETELDDLSKLLNLREEQIIADKNAINERSLELEKRYQEQQKLRLEIEQGLPNLRDEMFAEREKLLAEKEERLKKERLDLISQHKELQNIQKQVDNDFFEQREALQIELQRQRLEAAKNLEQEIHQLREEEFKKLEIELQQRRNNLKDEEQQIEQNKIELKREQSNLNFKLAELEQKNESIDKHIESTIQAHLEEFQLQKQQFKQDRQRLLSRIEQQNALHSLYDELQKELGDRSPEEVLSDLTDKNEAIKNLREELLKRPSQEIMSEYDRIVADLEILRQDNKKLKEEKREIQGILDAQEELEYEQSRLQNQYNSLEASYEAVKVDNNKLRETLARLSPAYNDPESIEQRIKNIKRPYLKNFVPRRQEVDILELNWLETIREKIEDYGLSFPYRILCAFHTALKISEWSPITVLAGVSGTGKSELPKLYSLFGGINFINVPVQPNWDSQESMLGYFNSISNSFEAQPMLNFLIQSREKLVMGSDNPEDNYNGLNDTVSLVLLDEMNLAHVELYFAEFLSKLEQRRGTGKNNIPCIDINLGSDIDPYRLSLGRNLLFAGTMNQDETTKSLSDKVIDRGTCIYFPRPNALHRREKLKPLPKQTDLLPIKAWAKWIDTESNLPDENIKLYKTLIEDINKCLGADGRALGHRVWQSIEYYMINHPLVKKLDRDYHPSEYQEVLKFAFEDQLVQKVMPKLRGIETRGYAKEHCLDPIRKLLADHKLDILEDFDKAMRVGHGQFSWASADYLNNEQSNERYEELYRLALEGSISSNQESTTNLD